MSRYFLVQLVLSTLFFHQSVCDPRRLQKPRVFPNHATIPQCAAMAPFPLLEKVTSTATLRDIVQIVDDRILTFDPDEKDRAKAFMERGFLPPGTKRYKDKRFMFDKVFNHEARQDDVYQATSQPLLKGLFDGYNATVFAYGVSY